MEADPAALGLAGFAMTTFLLSLFNCGILSTNAPELIMLLAFVYGGLA